MDSRKIKVSVIIRKVDDKQEVCRSNNDVDSYSVLDNIKHLLTKTSVGSDDISVEDTVCLLKASKLSNEIMADAFIDINREDMFTDKIQTISTIDDLINQINKYI